MRFLYNFVQKLLDIFYTCNIFLKYFQVTANQLVPYKSNNSQSYKYTRPRDKHLWHKLNLLHFNCISMGAFCIKVRSSTRLACKFYLRIVRLTVATE